MERTAKTSVSLYSFSCNVIKIKTKIKMNIKGGGRTFWPLVGQNRQYSSNHPSIYPSIYSGRSKQGLGNGHLHQIVHFKKLFGLYVNLGNSQKVGRSGWSVFTLA